MLLNSFLSFSFPVSFLLRQDGSAHEVKFFHHSLCWFLIKPLNHRFWMEQSRFIARDARNRKTDIIRCLGGWGGWYIMGRNSKPCDSSKRKLQNEIRKDIFWQIQNDSDINWKVSHFTWKRHKCGISRIKRVNAGYFVVHASVTGNT